MIKRYLMSNERMISEKWANSRWLNQKYLTKLVWQTNGGTETWSLIPVDVVWNWNFYYSASVIPTWDSVWRWIMRFHTRKELRTPGTWVESADTWFGDQDRVVRRHGTKLRVKISIFRCRLKRGSCAKFAWKKPAVTLSHLLSRNAR